MGDGIHTLFHHSSWFLCLASISNTPAVTAYLVIAAVVSIWGCFRSWRTALRFDGQGVMVRNAVRTYRIGWHEVRCFADGWVQRCLVPVG
jgi:hypothetical protein